MDKIDAEKRVESESNSQLTPDVPTSTPAKHGIPDGGLEAWSVVLGSSLAFFATFGVVNSYGVFQDYYQKTLLSASSSSTISIVGALQLFLLYGTGPLVGSIYDAFGTNILIPLGSLITVFSLMMLSLVRENQPYQIFLAQGLLFGSGIAMIFNPGLAVVGHWFRRRRAYAIGLVAAGSSLGGVCFPIMLQRLIPKVGFGWAVRIAAFIVMGCLLVACFTIRTRLPLRGHISLGSAVDLGGFRDIRYVLASIGAFLIMYAVFIPLFYIEVYADFQGVSPNLSKYLLPIINAFGIPSRAVPGLLADRFGSINVLVPSTLISSILCLGLWLPARNANEIIAFAALYGLFSGTFVSLLPAYIATITPMEKYGARLGSIYMIVAVASLAGTPTAGGILRVSDRSHFNGLIIFTGVLLAVGGCVMALTGFIDRRMRARAASLL
ncbi:Riboflavin transporter MCH5 [Grifola frondosa]|uniref:Riboflavin transporter MCH5 n=1 Tax=Grifola frondosa TaxID=5627 RepID=A0A1C7MDU9_GRIFR|nr:Riboflavin transporter MCH5 [Grifola frondosa]